MKLVVPGGSVTLDRYARSSFECRWCRARTREMKCDAEWSRKFFDCGGDAESHRGWAVDRRRPIHYRETCPLVPDDIAAVLRDKSAETGADLSDILDDDPFALSLLAPYRATSSASVRP